MSIVEEIADIILRERAGELFAAEIAELIVAKLHLEVEEHRLPVFVEDVPRREITTHVFADGQTHYANHVEFIDHARIVSPWFSTDCPDCQSEFGIHDRRHREITSQKLWQTDPSSS